MGWDGVVWCGVLIIKIPFCFYSHYLILLLLSVLHHSSFLMQVLGYVEWSVVKCCEVLWSVVKCCRSLKCPSLPACLRVCVAIWHSTYTTQHTTAWYSMVQHALHCPPGWLPSIIECTCYHIISCQGSSRNNTHPPRNMGVGKRTPSSYYCRPHPLFPPSHHTTISSFCPLILIPSSSSLHLLFIFSSFVVLILQYFDQSSVCESMNNR